MVLAKLVALGEAGADGEAATVAAAGVVADAEPCGTTLDGGATSVGPPGEGLQPSSNVAADTT